MIHKIFITFPVELNLIPTEKKHYYGPKHSYKKEVISIYDDWKLLTKSIPLSSKGTNYGIITGEKSNITVIDYTYNKEFETTYNFDISNCKTRRFTTPSTLGTHYYFKYESQLDTIYTGGFKNIKVINDCGYVFCGKGYKLESESYLNPIKMPTELKELLLSKQEEVKQKESKKKINHMYYELLRLLPDESLSHELTLYRIYDILCDLIIPPVIVKATIIKILRERLNNFDEEKLLQMFEKPIPLRSKITLSTLKKFIKNESPDSFNEWNNKWNLKKSIKSSKKQDTQLLMQLPPNIVYKAGSLEKCASIKAIDKSLTSKKLLTFNKEFTLQKKLICKSCQNLHRQGCCTKYTSTNRSSCYYINNIAIQ